MVNTDTRLTSYRDRLISLIQNKVEVTNDIKELMIEAKGVGLSKIEIAAVRLAAKRHFEAPEKRTDRENAEELAESLGFYADLPLGRAAVDRARVAENAADAEI